MTGRLTSARLASTPRRAVARALVVSCVAASLSLASPPARAQATAPAAHEDTAFDFMNLLSQHDMHNLEDESWNAYGQFTYILQWKPRFSAAYTNANGSIRSLVPDPEDSFTASFTLFFGARLWPGGEAYFVPEVIAEKALSGLQGLGASIQNFELQKTGSTTPSIYRSRTFLRQTIDFGGGKESQDSNPMQLGNTVDKRRVVLTAGTFTILDIFDKNNVTWDPRQTFLNMAFMTHASWDFAADARGYSLGAAAELYWGDWALRISRMAPPLNPNVLPLNVDFIQRYADALELEHDHVVFGQAGAVRLLGYRNHEVMGQFQDAINVFKNDPTKNAAACPPNVYSYMSGNVTAPDLCWVRKPNTKWGVGINLEQYVTPDIGVFLRAMYSDGKSEVDAFNPADRDLSFGVLAKGHPWQRPFDVTGLGFGSGWISHVHAVYLQMGGVDGFVGDGNLSQAPEMVTDIFYSFNLLKAIWLTGDYQHIWNPGFNSARGPVNVIGGRVHAEF